MITTEDLQRRFNFHPADEDTGNRHADVREGCYRLGQQFQVDLPEGREKSLVFTKLEEAMFWANAAIARQGK